MLEPGYFYETDTHTGERSFITCYFRDRAFCSLQQCDNRTCAAGCIGCSNFELMDEHHPERKRNA